MGVKTTGGQKIESQKDVKVLVTLANGFKNYNRAGMLWTHEKPYEVSQAEANELLSIVADNRRPFAIFIPPAKKLEAQGVEVAPRPQSESKRAPLTTSPEADTGRTVVKEIGSPEEAAELGLPAGVPTPEGEKLVTV